MDAQESKNFNDLMDALQIQIDENTTLKKGCIELSEFYVSLIEFIKVANKNFEERISSSGPQFIFLKELKQFVENLKSKLDAHPTLYFYKDPYGESEVLIPGILCSKDLLGWLNSNEEDNPG